MMLDEISCAKFDDWRRQKKEKAIPNAGEQSIRQTFPISNLKEKQNQFEHLVCTIAESVPCSFKNQP